MDTWSVRSLHFFFFVETKLLEEQKGKSRKVFIDVLIINETLFYGKGSGNELEGKYLEEAKAIESRVHDCYLNV